MDDVFQRLAQEGKLPEVPTLEDMRAFAADDPAFEALSEQDQMLSLLRKRLEMSYKLQGSAARAMQSKTEFARYLMLMSHGPKFAERILTDPECRRKLGVDD